MRRIILLVFLTLAVAYLISCSSGSQSGIASNANATEDTNANSAIKQLDPANLPPGLSASPVNISPNSNIPGIPVNANLDPKKVGPAPGIPSEEELKKPKKPGVTPTPGIPSQNEIKRALQQPSSNAPRPDQDVPMMKSVRKSPKP